MPINIKNDRGRDSQVGLESVAPKQTIKYLDRDNRETRAVRLLKCDVTRSYAGLIGQYGDADVLFEELQASDPEIDLELFGKYLTETTKVYVQDNRVVFHVEEVEIVLHPDGRERDRKPVKVEGQNINTDTPLIWTGRFIEKRKAVQRFVFAAKKQIVHVSGLTYDFLYEIAKDLHERNSLMIVGAGAKGEKPLTMQRGGKSYRGFLEGRIEGEKYCLLLHLSEMELKMPEMPKEESENV
jgi:hypothetical protein